MIRSQLKEIETEYKKIVEKDIADFNKEFFLDKENDKFVEDVRLKFLKSEKNSVEEKILDYEKIIEKCQGRVYQWLGDWIREHEIFPLVKKLNSLKYKIRLWEDKDFVSSGGVNEEEIQIANDADCSLFVEVVRKENERSWSLCPFHNEKTPSFCSYGNGGGWYCFSCSEGGNAITLIKKLYGYDFVQAVKFILDKI